MEIVFPASTENMQTQVVQIRVIADIFVENDENLTAILMLSSTDSAVELNPGMAAILVRNDDGEQKTLAINIHTQQYILLSVRSVNIWPLCSHFHNQTLHSELHIIVIHSYVFRC